MDLQQLKKDLSQCLEALIDKHSEANPAPPLRRDLVAEDRASVERFIRCLDVQVSISMLADGGWAARFCARRVLVGGVDPSAEGRIAGLGASPSVALIGLSRQLEGLAVEVVTLDGRTVRVDGWPALQEQGALEEALAQIVITGGVASMRRRQEAS